MTRGPPLPVTGVAPPSPASKHPGLKGGTTPRSYLGVGPVKGSSAQRHHGAAVRRDVDQTRIVCVTAYTFVYKTVY